MNIVDFLLTLPKLLSDFGKNLFDILNIEVATTFGNLSLIGILGGSILIGIMVAEIIKWFID